MGEHSELAASSKSAKRTSGIGIGFLLSRRMGLKSRPAKVSDAPLKREGVLRCVRDATKVVRG